MPKPFALDQRLAADTLPVVQLSHCDVRLMNDARFPWAILIPRIPGARELHHLTPAIRCAVFEEVMTVAAALERATSAEKINTGALGNLVPQLHIHVVARHADDDAWPGPVWGHGSPTPYERSWGQDPGSALVEALRDQLLG